MFRRLAITTVLLLLGSAWGTAADNPFGEEDCFPQEAYVTPDTQDADLAGDFSDDMNEFLDRLQQLLDSPPDDPEATGICVPGVGGPILLSEESQQDFDWTATPLWGETDTESGEATVPESTPFQDLFSTQERLDSMREALTENQLLDLLRGWPAPLPPYPANRTYDIKILQIDTSEFPVINVQFRVFLYDTAPPSFAVYANEIIQDVQIHEELLVSGDTADVDDYPDNKFTYDAQDGVDACYPDKPVVMGIAMDASGSLAQRVKNELLPNAQAYVDWVMGTDSDTGLKINPDGDARFDPPTEDANRLAFFLFSTEVNERAPSNQDPAPTGNFQGRTEGPQFQSRYDELKETVGEGASPIFNSMRAEMERLAAHDADCGIAKILVSMTDFLDNQGGRDELVTLANANDIFMANLLFGDPEAIEEYGGREHADFLAQNDRGVVVQNANQDPRQAFYDLHMGAARTYCLRYRTPFPERWNDTVRVTMTLPARENRWDESTATGLYPLPIVVPEDTEMVKVFFPLSDFIYTRFANLGDQLGLDGELELKFPAEPTDRFPVIDPNAFPVRAVGPTGLIPLEFEGGTPGPFVAPNDVTGAGLLIGFADQGNTSLTADSLDKWDQAFRVPTSPLIDLASGEVSPVSSGIHYAARVNLSNTEFTEGDCAFTIGDAIVAVQDRTPPSVFVKLSPEQGQIPNLLHIYERGTAEDPNLQVDADAWPLGPDEPAQDYDQDDGIVENDVITEKGAKSFGFGGKRARLDLTWVVATGDEVAMFSDPQDGIPWTKPLFFDHEADPDLIPEAGAIPDSPVDPNDEDLAAVSALPPFEPTGGGLLVPADVRVEVIVRARDNFAGLANISTGYRDSIDGQNVWVNPLEGVGDNEPPLHAKFDFNDPLIYLEDRSNEAYAFDYTGPRNVAPPYLPILTRSEMVSEPNRAGVCWWIESIVLPDRFRGGDTPNDRIDNVEFFQYAQSDDDEMSGNLDVAEKMGTQDENGQFPGSMRQLHVWARDEHGNSTRFEIPIRIMESDFKATAILNEGGRR
jgi:hypothetical protein